jgi:hypothetical protein
VISGTTTDNQTTATVTATDALGVQASVSFKIKPTSNPNPEC